MTMLRATPSLASAPTNPDSATDKAVYYFQQQGKRCCVLPTPGLLVWRTVAMLANEALDALQKESPAPRISIPPCVWSTICTGRWPGVNRLAGDVLRLLENLQQHYGEERYRPVRCCARKR